MKKIILIGLMVVGSMLQVGNAFGAPAGEKCAASRCETVVKTGVKLCFSSLTSCPGLLMCSSKKECNEGVVHSSPTTPTTVVNGQTLYYNAKLKGYQSSPPTALPNPGAAVAKPGNNIGGAVGASPVGVKR